MNKKRKKRMPATITMEVIRWKSHHKMDMDMFQQGLETLETHVSWTRFCNVSLPRRLLRNGWVKDCTKKRNFEINWLVDHTIHCSPAHANLLVVASLRVIWKRKLAESLDNFLVIVNKMPKSSYVVSWTECTTN
jgi:hypothetical protein